ncbi:MAG: chemotaxis protein CheB [Candidatus Acidiferrales bacterium]
MRVAEVTDRMKVEPNHHLCDSAPTRRCPSRITPCGWGRAWNPGADTCRSIASCGRQPEDQRSQSIGVILSGTDGTLGLAEIQAQGGVTFAQDESMATVAGPTPRDS